MKKIKFLFYIEHIERELSTVKSIIDSLNLSENDYVIASTNFSMGLSKILYRPEVVVTPWLYSDYCYQKITSFPFVNNIKLINLHHEQITNLDRIDALLPTGLAKEGFHFSWGKSFTEKMVYKGIDRSRIYTTGSVRLTKKGINFNKYDLAKNYLGNTEVADNKWMMFVSSYSWKDLPDSIIKKVEENGRKNVWDYKQLVLNSYNQTLSWIDSFLDVNPDITYIYRLHPSENLDQQLMNLKNKHRNFYIVNELPISDWIQNCDVIDLWISTSIAEVFIYKKPVRIIRPIQLPRNVEVEGFQNFEHINNVNDFIEVDRECPSYNIDNAKDYLTSFYSFGIDVNESTNHAIQEVLKTQPDVIHIKKSIKLKNALTEVIKDCIKIILVKTRLIDFTAFSRIKKSFFVMCKVNDFK